ncbi:glycoside hydrolase family 6 protein [Streptomyces olivoreticuli]|uniref:glycoside hydrolase family 6 protein n=1 Tax=Streptomyces olivoreticuli TaxID=68246 RepID=UPI00265A6C57|nr:glycoside hydrolase family 6 protein [Streptomyces olivoreticuli]WKK23676.1 glycoside hydrolase family 6 protein [Streptomyces olivoreticuli]
MGNRPGRHTARFLDGQRQSSGPQHRAGAGHGAHRSRAARRRGVRPRHPVTRTPHGLVRCGAALLVCTGMVWLFPTGGWALADGVGDEGGKATSPFWVEPSGPAAQQVRVWRERGRDEDAALLERIAERPTAVWLTDQDPKSQAEQVTRQAERAGRIPVLVAYNIPHRDCGQYSSGGAADAAHYRAWAARAAEGIGTRQAWVVLEPDALAQWASGCVPGPAAAERLTLLAEAVQIFKAQPGTSVYLDAGNPGWIADEKHLADALKRAGVARADGFALNVSNFHTTPVTRAYGDRLSALLDGAHYVVDTSRNGNGPLPADKEHAPDPMPPTPAPVPPPNAPPPPPTGAVRNGAEAEDDDGDGMADGWVRSIVGRAAGASGDEPWCNPPGRALGTPPTTATGSPLIDAFLWIKRPGESDGACRGAPPAGHWWADYALRLAGATPTGH